MRSTTMDELARVGALTLALLLSPSAHAHDEWADGKPVPDWVKHQCCGPADVHHLRPDQVHQVEGGYLVDGFNPAGYGSSGGIAGTSGWTYSKVIPAGHILPSQDGDWWAFYRENGDGTTGPMYCFFGPMDL